MGIIIRGLALAAAAMTCLSAQASLYETFPEYSSVGEFDRQQFSSAKLFDSESESDVLTYTKPFSWYGLWLEQDKAYSLSIGSVASKHFLIDNNLKLRQDITPNVAFRLVHFNQSHFNREYIHTVIELIFLTQKKLNISLYGETFLQKQDDDLGIAFTYHLSNKRQLRLFYTMVNFDHNKRATGDDRYQNSPNAFGFTSTTTRGDGEFSELAVRTETESQLRFPNEDYKFVFSRQYLALKTRVKLETDSYVNFELVNNNSLQQNIPGVGSTTVAARSKARSASQWLQWESPYQLLAHHLLVGIKHVSKQWDSEQGVVRHTDTLPHLWLKPLADNNPWRWGLETSFHKASGPRSLRSPEDIDRATEWRMNIAYDQKLLENSMISLLFTVDLDRFGTGDTWEGGNCQFQIFF